MSKTQEVLDKLPKKIYHGIRMLRESYVSFSSDEIRHETKEEARGYLNALEDFDLVSHTERRLLFTYITLPFGDW